MAYACLHKCFSNTTTLITYKVGVFLRWNKNKLKVEADFTFFLTGVNPKIQGFASILLNIADI